MKQENLNKVIARAQQMLAEFEKTAHSGISGFLLTAAIKATAEANDLNLEKLLSFDDFNFSHDVFGLLRHSVLSGELTDCFWPRCGAN